MKEYKFYVEDPSALDLNGIVERLGALIGYYRPGQSTYERTKEMWEALEMLLKLSEKMWHEWIPLLVERYVPQDFSLDDATYFKKLLHTLLEKYSAESRGCNPAIKRALAKILRSALDSASKNPYPQICFLVRESRPERLSEPRFRDRCKNIVGGGQDGS